MSRPVAKTLPDSGLLVGWSLESMARKPVFGFHTETELQKPQQFLEPILQTGEGHLITIAPTGTGKGVSAIIPALLRYQGSVIVIDPKGENYAVTAKQRKAMGQKVVLLDPFEITQASRLDRAKFNPLDYISPDAPSFVEDIEMIASLLAGDEMESSREPFWPLMGYQLIVFLLAYQFRKMAPADWNLEVTRKLLARGPAGLSDLGKAAQSSDDELLKSLAGVVSNPAESTFGGYWAYAQSMLSFLKGDLLERNLQESTFSLQELVDGEPVTFYLVIPPEKLKSHQRLLRLWLATFIAAMTNRTRKPETPTLMMLDEAAQLGYMPQIEQAITLLRGYGVKVWTFWQDVSQLQKLYPASWETILNNCVVQQYFGQSTDLAAEGVRRISGFGPVSAIRQLDRSEMVLSLAGDEPVLVQKPNYLKDPAFAGLFDANPFYLQGQGDDIGLSKRIFRRHYEFDDVPTLAPRRFKTKDKAPLLDHELAKRVAHNSINSDRWQEVSGDVKAEAIAAVEQQFWMPYFADGSRLKLRRWQPPFYQDVWHYEVTLDFNGVDKFGYWLQQGEGIIPLSGRAGEIYSFNHRQGLELDESQLVDYLAFYCSIQLSDEGRLFLVDHPDELVFTEKLDEEYLKALTHELRSCRIIAVDAERQMYLLEATVLVGATLGLAEFEVSKIGLVNMVSFKGLFSDVPTVLQSAMDAAGLTWRAKIT